MLPAHTTIKVAYIYSSYVHYSSWISLLVANITHIFNLYMRSSFVLVFFRKILCEYFKCIDARFTYKMHHWSHIVLIFKWSCTQVNGCAMYMILCSSYSTWRHNDIGFAHITHNDSRLDIHTLLGISWSHSERDDAFIKRFIWLVGGA